MAGQVGHLAFPLQQNVSQDSLVPDIAHVVPVDDALLEDESVTDV